MGRSPARQHDAPRGFSSRQSPLVEDAKEKRRVERKPTSHLEIYWPFYLGFSLPALLFGTLSGGLIIAAAGIPGKGVLMITFGLPVPLLGFLFASLVLTRIFASIRGGAETLGNLTFLSVTNTGFKIGAAIGLGLFFWFTPAVLGDPFTGNPSAPSAIVAQFMLKAIGFMGFVGIAKPAGFASAALFCFIAYFIVRFYLKLLNKVLQRLSALYGFASKIS